MRLLKPQDKYRNDTDNSQIHGEATLTVDASSQEIYSFLSETERLEPGRRGSRMCLELSLLIAIIGL